ncbi:MAG: ribonuclease P protein component [Candidatus Omnitrophica bacterium CG07_land_8_20_14_0_80_42_15]|uniref:Ribonuclease P protein component n=1 Tax=Candidatus Aquitaenariimonas noxiae TaxID=1974741 RepID=A0A2J0L186_9BACT|nr:MAG: ribonuclease P protein component [Candidatus Omnitrophica bacterium CG07_land_8_20_14_0_80_42_15]
MGKTLSLKRQERLKGNPRFKVLKEKAKIVYGASFTVSTLPNNLSFNRVGISISSRRIPKSVERNRIKRLIRETYRLNKNKLKIGFDILVKPRGTSKTKIGLKQVETDLMAAFKKSNMLI